MSDPVTVTVARRVAPGREADFATWSDGLTPAATRPRRRSGRCSWCPRRIYGLNVGLTAGYGWALTAWLLPLRLLVVSVPVTALMTWLVMPHAARFLQNWLYPLRGPSCRTS